MFSLAFWKKIYKERQFPDRSAESLRTAWKKFSKFKLNDFLSQAVKKDVRFSHHMQYPPKIPGEVVNGLPALSAPVEERKALTANNSVENINMSVLNEDTMLSQGPQENVEFVLAVDEAESVIAFSEERKDQLIYSLKPVQKRKAAESLDAMYAHWEVEGLANARKRRKEASKEAGDDEEISLQTLREREQIFTPEELKAKMEVRISIEKDLETRKREVFSNCGSRKQKEEDYFHKLSRELRRLAKEYNKDIEEIHMLFMEVSCDIEDLRKLLKGSGCVQKWSMLEDLAIQNDPNTEEYQHVENQLGDGLIKKRKKFLEL